MATATVMVTAMVMATDMALRPTKANKENLPKKDFSAEKRINPHLIRSSNTKCSAFVPSTFFPHSKKIQQKIPPSEIAQARAKEPRRVGREQLHANEGRAPYFVKQFNILRAIIVPK